MSWRFLRYSKYKNHCLELQSCLVLTPVQAHTVVTGINNNQPPLLSSVMGDDMGCTAKGSWHTSPSVGKEPAFTKTKSKTHTLLAFDSSDDHPESPCLLRHRDPLSATISDAFPSYHQPNPFNQSVAAPWLCICVASSNSHARRTISMMPKMRFLVPSQE